MSGAELQAEVVELETPTGPAWVVHHPEFSMLVCTSPAGPGQRPELRRYFLTPAEAAALAAQLTARPAAGGAP